MNFRYLPEMNQVWAYPAFWIFCLVASIIMLLLFHHRNWL